MFTFIKYLPSFLNCFTEVNFSYVFAQISLINEIYIFAKINPVNYSTKYFFKAIYNNISLVFRHYKCLAAKL